MKKHSEAVIITVGTTEQKKLCEKLISDMKNKPMAEIVVVCDEDFGGRIGSGGAVAGVIERFYESGKKLLIINSGGFSKRSVSFAVRGKLFADFLVDGEEKTLVEILIKNGINLFSFIESGVIVSCSDILVSTDFVRDKLDENSAFCIKTDIETASRHGVMYPDKNGFMDIYPHKTDCEKLKEISASYDIDGVPVDTGLVYLTDRVCRKIKSFSRKEKLTAFLSENNIDLNFYPDIVFLLAKRVDKEEYLSVSDSEKHREIKEKLYDLISDYSLKVIICPDGQDFVHMGSVREALENITAIAKSDNGTVLINSITDGESSVGNDSVLDNALLRNCMVGERCFISDVTLEDVEIPDNTAVCGIKLSDGMYVTIVCSVDENPKEKKGKDELWNIPRFFKGRSFTESYVKFINRADEEKFSMSYCTENADADYYITRQRYLRDRIKYSPNDEYIKIREEILNEYFSGNKIKRELKCVCEKAEINLPLRVNLSGTWTDAMPYCIYNSGEVVNMAVTVDGNLPVSVFAERIDGNQIEFCSDGLVQSFSFEEKSDAEEFSDFNMHKAVLKTFGIAENTKLHHGIRLGTKVTGIDKGSGLGTSSILLAGCFMALSRLTGEELSDEEIFRKVFVAEQVMETGGGWQDQVGGIIPGIKITSSSTGIHGKLSVNEIKLTESFRNFVSERLVLIPTGQRHFGRFIVSDVAERFLEKNPETLEAFGKIKSLNTKILKSIENENFKEFSQCINEHFALLRKISPEVSTEKIDIFSEKLLEKLADAVSVCGAGGGGYLLAVMKEDVTPEDINEFIRNNFSYISGEVKRVDIFY